MNLEVVKRGQPCRFYADPTTTASRSCVMATHVRPEGTDRTYCGHDCTEDVGWVPLPDTHPEDIDTLERCTVCYERYPRPEMIL